MNKGAVLVLGARSDIGMAVAYRFAQAGYDIQLAARNVTSLDDDRADIEIRNSIKATLHEFNALNIQAHEAFVTTLPELPIIAVCTTGYMGEQKESERDMTSASLVMRSNYEGPSSVLGILANHFEKRGSGTLVGVSSVAGERGRASNYVYGSAKAGFTAFLSGLRNRLSQHNVNVITVLPGFVNTRMTAGMQLPIALTAQPSDVAASIVAASAQGKNIIYLKPIWRLIMLVIKSIPEKLFKRMTL
ncbi:MAG TPA: short-chain dehydrogenase [Gammaproteobacteria bacterium]|jgi:short-subunit dehydrogenase|nr:short-chain dehydrogenase [Gammaproteobacteria bacterium]